MAQVCGAFIAPTVEFGSAPLFRRDFETLTDHGVLESAMIRVSALGTIEAWINGVAVSDDLLAPGWTSYEWRVHVVEYDVTHLIQSRSTIALMVGNGWYRGRLGWFPTRTYGDQIAGFAELRLRYSDGFEQLVATDQSWACGPGPVVSNDLYDGQTIDARLNNDSWRRPGFSSPDWVAARRIPYSGDLQLDKAPPVRRMAELSPRRAWRSRGGATLFDFGQNIVGFLRLKVSGAAGTVLTARHAEVLEDGELCVRPLRTAAATDQFILSGGADFFEPTLTFHGFRYAEISGWPEAAAPLPADAVTAVVISSDLSRTGYFECSVPDLNTFHANVVRGMRGNFIDIPTDCPQRDERLGWTGDISAFAPTASFLFDVRSFLADWLEDLKLEQRAAGGLVPFVVPDVLKRAERPEEGASATTPAAIWSDAVAWVPWALWQSYGDSAVLADTFEGMCSHARLVRSRLSPTGVWDSGFQFGDWLDPDAPADHPEQAKADSGVVATACAFRTATIVADVARVLNHPEAATEFQNMADELRGAFAARYVGGGRIQSDCATVYALAICFGLLDAEQMNWAGRRLADLVAAAGHRISTGFAGTPFVADALTLTGHERSAYRLLLQRECPSWLYPVTMGATTVWERWDSVLPDGSINAGEMTSLNHYALGSVADWLHRVVGGLAPLEPGYRKILIAPRPGPGIDWARTSLQTVRGPAAVSWRVSGDQFIVAIEIPDSASGIFRWPGHQDQELGPGEHTITVGIPDDKVA